MNDLLLQVFFSKAKLVPNNPEFLFYDCDTFFGLPLWKHDGKPVFVWSVDCLTASDERWVVFGPFDQATAERTMAKLVLVQGVDGCRIIQEHCFLPLLLRHYEELPRMAWTDG